MQPDIHPSTTNPDLLAPLLADHELARKVLDAMVSKVHQPDRAQAFDLLFWRAVLRFFGDYFDAIHHPVEEQILVPLLSKQGYAQPHLATDQMVREHQRMLPCRRHLQNAVHVQSEPRISASVRTFVNMHRAHMDLEERHVFPIARAVLNAVDQQDFRDGLAALERTDVRQARMRAEQIAGTICDTV